MIDIRAILRAADKFSPHVTLKAAFAAGYLLAIGYKSGYRYPSDVESKPGFMRQRIVVDR